MDRKVSLSQIESGAQLKELLAWFQKLKDAGFAEKIDSLWKETRQAAEKSGYGPGDVDRLIAAVRKNDSRA